MQGDASEKMATQPRTLIFILGPTASGKSRVAARLARGIGGEVISCDSMQVYRDMDIITQAPGEDILSLAPHHLVRMIPPEEDFNAARFTEMAKSLIERIKGRGKTPVVAGGTGLYVKSLVDGIFKTPPRDDELRARLESLAAEKGRSYLHTMLAGVDPATAGRLHPHNTRRVIRALEVYELTGRTMSDKISESEGVYAKYDCRMFAMEVPRAALYTRINKKVEQMFKSGLVEEVRRVRSRDISLTAGKALGIKEAAAFIDGSVSLETAREELKKNTRRYAKRQMTWFKGDKRIAWIHADRDTGEIVDEVIRKI